MMQVQELLTLHNFNPRTPVWGATFKQWCTDEGQAFQSAHPYVGCDIGGESRSREIGDFNPRTPMWGATY